MDTPELLPCPFCGCTAVLNAEDVPLHDEPELCCDHCNATNTRDFWNRRAGNVVVIDREAAHMMLETCDFSGLKRALNLQPNGD